MPATSFLVQCHSGGAATRQPKGADPKLDQLIDAQIREADVNKRIDLIKDIQRYMVTTMIASPIHYQCGRVLPELAVDRECRRRARRQRATDRGLSVPLVRQGGARKGEVVLAARYGRRRHRHEA